MIDAGTEAKEAVELTEQDLAHSAFMMRVALKLALKNEGLTATAVVSASVTIRDAKDGRVVGVFEKKLPVSVYPELAPIDLTDGTPLES